MILGIPILKHFRVNKIAGIQQKRKQYERKKGRKDQKITEKKILSDKPCITQNLFNSCMKV